MKTFRCYCGNTVYFENSECLNCGRRLGFLPQYGVLSALERVEGRRWRALHPLAQGREHRMCNNFEFEMVCNWMVADEESHAFCRACRLNHVIPNLNDLRSRVHWQRLEEAKRRLIYTLYRLGLPVQGRTEDPQHGLAFEFLEDADNGSEFFDGVVAQQVITGHRHGIITINVAEADSSVREGMREKMQEQYRTLLGHFRHEVGHYYWQRLIEDSRWLNDFRTLFGDERADYGSAMASYYQNGAPSDWQRTHISAYAWSHPWEDWAESWAHYLHMTDTLETAHDFGFALNGVPLRALLLEPADPQQDAPALQASPESSFEELREDWVHLTNALNALNRSMGLPDAYPFTPSPLAGDKLRFVHTIIADWRNRAVG